MNSIATIYGNDKLYLDSLLELDPHLWEVRMKINEWALNPELVPPIIEQLGRLNTGSGYGEIKIILRDHKVFKIEGTDSRLLDLDLTV